MNTYNIVDGNISAFINGETYAISQEHPKYKEIFGALLEKQYDSIPDLANASKAIEKWSLGEITVELGKIQYKDFSLDDEAISSRILKMIEEDADCQPLVNLVKNIFQNPDETVIPQIYSFLRKNNLPITKDGHFLAYKKVKENYKDIHSGKFDNTPGLLVQEDRIVVDKDPNQTCSRGLHVASWNYLAKSGYGSGQKLIIVKVNPKNVCSVPVDYDNSKMRVCEYYVLEDSKDQNNPQSIYEDKTVWSEESPEEEFLNPEDFYQSDDYCDDDYCDDDDECCDCGNHIEDCSCDSCIDCGNDYDYCTCDDDDDDSCYNCDEEWENYHCENPNSNGDMPKMEQDISPEFKEALDEELERDDELLKHCKKELLKQQTSYHNVRDDKGRFVKSQSNKAYSTIKNLFKKK